MHLVPLFCQLRAHYDHLAAFVNEAMKRCVSAVNDDDDNVTDDYVSQEKNPSGNAPGFGFISPQLG